MNRSHPAPNWRIELRRTIVEGDVVVCEVRVPADDGVSFCAAFYEVRDGRVRRGTEYWVDEDPAAAPEWRAQWREP